MNEWMNASINRLINQLINWIGWLTDWMNGWTNEWKKWMNWMKWKEIKEEKWHEMTWHEMTWNEMKWMKWMTWLKRMKWMNEWNQWRKEGRSIFAREFTRCRSLSLPVMGLTWLTPPAHQLGGKHHCSQPLFVHRLTGPATGPHKKHIWHVSHINPTLIPH